jgi:outer membrane protein OmpA-like peptidoglycan-associated protein
MNYTKFLIPVVLLLTLPQCGWRRGATKPKANQAVNMPLDKKNSGTKVGFFNDDVEAFVLEEEPTAMAMNNDDASSFNWNDAQKIGEKFDTICFDYDSSDIRKDQEPKLSKNVQKAASHKDETIVCKGHADKLGKASRMYNVALSEKRAHTVAKTFEEKGFSTKVFGVGYQEADETLAMTKKAQEPNRKVEVYTVTA